MIFAGAGTILAVSLTINARLIRRFGARTMVLVASCAAVALATTGLAAFSATGGRPPLLVWFVWESPAGDAAADRGAVQGQIAAAAHG